MKNNNCIRRWSAAPLVGLTALMGILTVGRPAEAQVELAAVRGKVDTLLQDVLESEAELTVTKRRSKVLRMKQSIFRASVADPTLIEVVAFGSREIEIIGKETGSTTLTLWMGDEDQPQILSLLVTVAKDTAVDDRRRLQYGELQQMINEMFPDSKIQLIPIADKLIVRGQARDEEEATQIMSIIRRHSGNLNGPNGTEFFGARTTQGEAAEPFPDAGTLPQATVVNMLQVPGEKQVMLKVRIAELKRSAIRQLGADFDFNVSDFFLSSVLSGGGNIIASNVFDNADFNLVLNALSRNGAAKILAEPNLVVLSGEPASFIAGGEFAVPTVVGVGGAQAATTDFKGFGTQLEFTPTVLDRDRIRLQVSPTFSSLNEDNTVNGIFGLDTRSVSTTVDLREGQVLAIAGLLLDEQKGENSRIPFVGDIPVVNIPFANKKISRDETELLIVVSPELVHPLEPEEAPAILPGMEVTEPDDVDFFFYGRIEGRPGCDHRSTVWPLYQDFMKHCDDNYETYRRSEDFYIHGPHGFSD